MFTSMFSKAAIAVAGGALALTTAVGPATAVTAGGPDPGAPVARGGHHDGHGDGHKGRDGRHHHKFKGKVIARSGLLLRDGPSTSARVVGSKPFGAIVRISCKVNGENIDGNPRWYLLSKHGKWAWASARYIKNIGPAPRWC